MIPWMSRAPGRARRAPRVQGYGPQKNFAVGEARHDWVLCLDADERVSPELADAIRALFAGGSPHAPAYAMARRNRFLGRWLAHGEGYPDWNVRLFDRRRARWTDDVVHEHVVADGRVARLDGDLLHASAESIEDYVAKQNRYTTLQAGRCTRGERAGSRASRCPRSRDSCASTSSRRDSSTASRASRTSRSARSRASSST